MRKNPSAMGMLCYPLLRDNSMIRLYIELKEPVQPDALRRAVKTAMERYPYFTVQFVPKQGDILPEIVYNPRPVVVRAGRGAPTLGSEDTNRHLLAFGYEGKTVIVDFSHGLADGTGLMEMVKTLLYYYFHEATGQWLPADGIRTVETPITAEETDDPYLDPPPLEERFSPGRRGAPDSFSLAEDGVSDAGPATLWRFRVEEDAFLRYSRENDGSPATMFAVFIAKAMFRLHPDLTRDVNIMLARNLRPGFGTPLAHHSLADAFLLCYPAKCRDWSVERLGGVSRGIVYLNTDRDAMLTSIHDKRAFLQQLYAAKDPQEISDRIRDSFREASRRCAAVSYVGRCFPRQMDAVVEGIYSVVGAMGTLVMEINAVNGRFCCTLVQGFAEDTYIRAIAEELRREGIEPEIDEPEPLILAKIEM